MLYTDNPIIVQFAIPSRNVGTMQRYTIYSKNDIPLYIGSVFAYDTTLNIDITKAVQSFAWGGSLKPTYNQTTQHFEPSTGIGFVADNGEFLQTTFKVQLNGLATDANPKTIDVSCVRGLQYREEANVEEYKGNTNIQNLLYSNIPTSFVSHYPNIMTSNYWLSGVVGVGDKYKNEYENIYLCTNRLHSYNIPVNNNSVWFNIPLNTIYNSLPLISEQDIEPDPIVYDDSNRLIGGNSRNITTGVDCVVDGGLASLTPTNVFVGGGSSLNYPIVDEYGNPQTRTFFTEDYTFYLANAQYIEDEETGQFKQKFAKVDKCNAQYYLMWQDANFGVVSWGFDGSTTINQDKQTLDGWYLEKAFNIKNPTSYNLQTKLISNDEYLALMGIESAKDIYLYCPETDRGEYVKLKTTSITTPNAKRERQIKLELLSIKL